MSDAASEPLAAGHCVPCEGGVPVLSSAEARDFLAEVPGWTLDDNAKRIIRLVNASDFAHGVAHINAIAEIAEAEQHHPDLMLTGYRHLRIELTTHAIGGLSKNDFILAAKINDALDAPCP